MDMKESKRLIKQAEELLTEANAAAIKRDLNKVVANLSETLQSLLNVTAMLVDDAEAKKAVKKAATKKKTAAKKPSAPRKQTTPIKLDNDKK